MLAALTLARVRGVLGSDSPAGGGENGEEVRLLF